MTIAARRCTLLMRVAVICTTLMLAVTAHASMALQRGVNLSHWFEHEGRSPVSAQDLRTLHALGFDHVRIPVDPKRLARVSGVFLKPLQQAIHAALDAKLDVIVDMSPDEAYKQALEHDNATFAAYADLLRNLALMLDAYPPNRVALEVLNEPQFYGWGGAANWQAQQARLIESVRAVAPELTVIVMGRMGGSLEGLAELEPYAYRNIVYAFHFYLPYIFTHQGAPWMRVENGTAAAGFSHVLYPSALARSSPPAIELSGTSMRLARNELGSYITQGWSRATIDDQLTAARRLADLRGVRIVCDEFGVIREGVDTRSRNRWLHDVRASLEAADIGWTVWDYADDFAIASRRNVTGQRDIDPATLNALGLKKE